MMIDEEGRYSERIETFAKKKQAEEIAQRRSSQQESS